MSSSTPSACSRARLRPLPTVPMDGRAHRRRHRCVRAGRALWPSRVLPARSRARVEPFAAAGSLGSRAVMLSPTCPNATAARPRRRPSSGQPRDHPGHPWTSLCMGHPPVLSAWPAVAPSTATASSLLSAAPLLLLLPALKCLSPLLLILVSPLFHSKTTARQMLKKLKLAWIDSTLIRVQIVPLDQFQKRYRLKPRKITNPTFCYRRKTENTLLTTLVQS